MNNSNLLSSKKLKIYFFSVIALLLPMVSSSQKACLIDLVCHINGTSMRLNNVSKIYGDPTKIVNSVVEVTLSSKVNLRNNLITVGVGWKQIETNVDYISNYFSSNNLYYAASSIYIKNSYVTFPIAYEMQLVDLNHETFFYCRPAASLNVIISNKRFFYRTLNYKYANMANTAFMVFDKTKFGSFVHPSVDFGIKTGQNRYVIDFGFRINSNIKHLYGDFAGSKASLGLYLGLGYKFN